MQVRPRGLVQSSGRTEQDAPEPVDEVADDEVAVALEAPHERLVDAVAEGAALEAHLARAVVHVVAALLVRAADALEHLRGPHAHDRPVLLVRVLHLHAHHQRRQRARVLVARAPAHPSRTTHHMRSTRHSHQNLL